MSSNNVEIKPQIDKTAPEVKRCVEHIFITRVQIHLRMLVTVGTGAKA